MAMAKFRIVPDFDIIVQVPNDADEEEFVAMVNDQLASLGLEGIAEETWTATEIGEVDDE